jgi:N-acetyl-gamma-glutamyl-phosphate reductase
MYKYTMKLGLVGATGLTGVELTRLFYSHPYIEDFDLFSSSEGNDGIEIADLYPHLKALKGKKLKLFSPEVLKNYDFVFLATPHGVSQEIMPQLITNVGKIIDLSADFRIKDHNQYSYYYGKEHKCFELVNQFSYGLPEIYREEIKLAKYIAVPGCYSTAVILALYPLARNNLVEGPAFINGLSGVSGAGLKLDSSYLFSVVNEGLKPYSIKNNHRHIAEMTQELKIPLVFCPHLIPMTRGILISCYVALKEGFKDSVIDVFKNAYLNEPFIKLVDKEVSTKDVLYTNNCMINVSLVESSKFIIIFSVIDNLIKGAAGQALQCFNLMAGFKEEAGLLEVGPWP